VDIKKEGNIVAGNSHKKCRLKSSPLTFRQALHWIGSGLALIGIVFVAIRLNEYWGSQDLSHISPVTWAAIGSLAVFYGSANILLALAWRQLLAQFGPHVTRMWAIRVYGVSQLAKYVPGNIFHIAGRQAIGMSAGLSGTALAKSTFWELSLLATTGMLYGWLVLPLLLPKLPLIASSALLLGSVWALAYLLRRVIGLQASLCFKLQMIFLAISAGVFTALLGVVVPSTEYHPQTWLFIGGAYVVAWLVGLVTPGAPAGVGVRELVLLFLLKNFVVESDLIVTVLLGRMVTVMGDVLFFSAAFFLPAKKVFVEKL
jgi:uncharacterized membrane protein YbhN (UPF0104 family)